MCCTGYIIAVASVVTISGGLAEIIIKHYLSITIPWQAISAILSLGALALIVAGAKPSTKVAAALFVFQVVLLLVVAIALLFEHSGHINGNPFDPSHLHRGFSGLGGSRSRYICSWVGRTRPRWPRSITTRVRASRARSSPASW